MHTQAIAVSEKKLFVRPSSKMLAMLSSLHFIPAAHHVELVLSLFVIFLLSPCFTPKASEMVYPEAHSSARRFRGAVVCSLKQQNARVAVVIALFSGCASRELVLSLFFDFRRAYVKNVRNGYPEAHSSARRFRGGAICSPKQKSKVKAALCSRRCRHRTLSRLRIT